MTKSAGVGRGSNPASHCNTARGDAHHRWGNGRSVTKDGHVRVRVGKSHPLADPNGYAYEHLLVWVAAGNPRPPCGWLLHHANECKTDNRLSNLELMTRAEHNRRHNAERVRDAQGRLLGKKAAGRLLDGVEHNGYPVT